MNKDWWMGRTEEQQARKAQAKADFKAIPGEYRQAEADRKAGKGAAGKMTSIGKTLMLWLTLPMLATLLLGIPGLLIAGVIITLVTVSKRRKQDEN